MNMHGKRKAILTLLLIAALLLGTIPAASASGSRKAVVKAGSMKVYAQKSPHKYLGALPKGTVVTVKARSGAAALISYNGKTGVVRASDLKAATAQTTSSKASGEKSASKTVETVRATRIYKKASTASGYVDVRKGTRLTLLAVNGKYAKVSRDGKVGYTLAKHLGAPGSAKTDAPKAQTEAEKGKAMVTNRATRVYKQASTASASVKVKKGTKLTLLAVSGSCAKVKLSGKVGYMNKAHLSTAEAKPKDTGDNGGSGANDNDSGSKDNGGSEAIFDGGTNAQVIYRFLVAEMGYNKAAACGVLANIKYESGYRPTVGGDGGTSYGIVQWHAGRKTSLINWCKNNDYDYKTLKGQLYFLKYELVNRYPMVHKYLKGVENSAKGAYDAGYYFCYHFEAPANRASKSVTRGNYAKNTVYAAY